MISSVLERLEDVGGAMPLRKLPLRWYAGLGGPSGGYSSGRFSSPFRLHADRLDDGILVAPRVIGAAEDGPVEDPANVQANRHGKLESDDSPEWIVWIGDIELCALDAEGQPVDGTRIVPTLRPHCGSTGVDLEWPVAASSFHMGLTVLGRPAGRATFENDALDASVELRTEGHQTIATMRPYDGLGAVEVAFQGTATFQPDANWLKGLEVTDATGLQQAEDRFSPGSFHVQHLDGASSIVVTFRAPGPGNTFGEKPGARSWAQAATPRRARVAPAAVSAMWNARFEAIALPGQLMAEREPSVDAWSRAVEAGLQVGEGDALKADTCLWWVRAARLGCDAPWSTGVFSPDAAREMRMDIVRPRLAELVRDLELRAGGRPLEAVLEGSARWSEAPVAPSASTEESHPRIAVESAALLHDACVWLSELGIEARDRAVERHARQRAAALHRWFQRSFWLQRPDRPADVAFASDAGRSEAPSIADRVAAFALGPGMLLAASFEDAPLDARQRRAIVRATEARLLTTAGVRTLDREDASFDPTSMSRGAVWPWLLGPLVEASLRGFGPERGRHRALSVLLDGLEDAPEAWAWDRPSAGPPVPVGGLRFAVNGAEAARARWLIAAGSLRREGGVA